MIAEKKKRDDIRKQAEELVASWVLVETNEGTYGATECRRAVGCGDPQFGNYHIYARVGDGRRRHEGCDKASAPGYARHFSREFSARQAELVALRKKLDR